ncbi:Transcriptional regulator, LysR family [gamma proteobacterium HdN1]|nr:Transcriptional regulator, LysR family [gamma proteobacterium HdN1]
MDIELARTFLEIMHSGSFVQAADRLHVTQTTVTARVRTLEQVLDCQLFVRGRTGARLTPDGERFVSYATALVNTWSRAKAELSLPLGHTLRLSIGAETSLWNPLLLQWLLWMRAHHPAIALRTEVSNANHLLKQVEEDALDAVLVHRPGYYAGLNVELLIEEKLVFVRSSKQPEPFLFVDWGASFVDQFDTAMPQPRHAALTFNLGPLALQYLLQVGGSGYFRSRAVERLLESGEVEKVPDSPEFTYSVFLVYGSAPSSTLEAALSGFRTLTGDTDWAR